MYVLKYGLGSPLYYNKVYYIGDFKVEVLKKC